MKESKWGEESTRKRNEPSLEGGRQADWLLRDGVEDGRTRLIICLGNLFQRDV